MTSVHLHAPGFTSLRLWVLTCTALCISACTSLQASPPLPTASSVDLSRYSGLWHEVARLPMWAQRNCRSSTAEYQMLPSGNISVRNACTTTSGEEISIQGTATIVDSVHHSKLHVEFDQWAAKLVAWFTDPTKGNYWILHVDSDYQRALVGTPDREYLWILSRSPSLEEPPYQELVRLGHSLGFATNELIRSTP